MKLRTKPPLLELTNKFLNDFFNLSAELDNRKRPDNDSYSFNYTLMSALEQSDYIKNIESKDSGFPMPSAGTNLIEALYSSNLIHVPDNLMYVIQNFDEQLHDDNEFTVLKMTPKGYSFNVKSQNVNFKCFVELTSDKKFNNLILSDKKGMFHKLETGYILGEAMNSPEDVQKTLWFPEKFWLSRIKDINEFYSVLDCIYNEIKEELEAEN